MSGRTSARTLSIAGTALAALLITAPAAVPAAAEPAGSRDDAIGGAALQTAFEGLHDAGMPAVYGALSDDGERWSGAAGTAALGSERPALPNFRHRVASVTKSFVAATLLRLAARGEVDLDAPVGDYLPEVVPGERGQAITVRMLLNHTSGINDLVSSAFPSLNELSVADLDRYRFRTVAPEQLAAWGLAMPPVGEPGVAPGVYSNTNYVLAGLVIEAVTGRTAESVITEEVIRPAGLRHTYFPENRPRIRGPHAGAYESMFQTLVPPRDYSTYNVSYIWMAGDLVSTASDLTRFYRALADGEILAEEQLAEMRTTVPVNAGGVEMPYGLGLMAYDTICGRYWGHNGGLFGYGTDAGAHESDDRAFAFGSNLTRHNALDENGVPQPHPIDAAFGPVAMALFCPPGAQPEDVRPLLAEGTASPLLGGPSIDARLP
ncbi:serine hydrolase domain-containing protein [Allonocardiopsis opalescens]|uniref:D-alanyl-D-alanine carboxypeptidase n=1 Tax=Allonocardiopsis opalescens TaxID=1144618 RepID=A0A2T0Q9U9_9ACTN|nr:serine hydrolase domain-containing protein [Allonocardiopsis opalescens]PRY00590.1 D-alanyl-D-alanine carboxypeptidase [Allonocardiopsis opalescens]